MSFYLTQIVALCKYDHVPLTDLSLLINPEDFDVVTAPMPYLM